MKKNVLLALGAVVVTLMVGTVYVVAQQIELKAGVKVVLAGQSL